MGNRVLIKMESHGRGSVWLDGKKLHGVTGFSLSAGVEKLNLLNLQMKVDDLEIEGPVELTDEPQC